MFFMQVAKKINIENHPVQRLKEKREQDYP